MIFLTITKPAILKIEIGLNEDYGIVDNYVLFQSDELDFNIHKMTLLARGRGVRSISYFFFDLFNPMQPTVWHTMKKIFDCVLN